MFAKNDVEAGNRPLYPMMLESPQLRWSFIRKVYSIVTLQLLLTVAVASVVVTVHPISHFFATTRAGLALWIVLIITPFIGMDESCDLGNCQVVILAIVFGGFLNFVDFWFWELQFCVRCFTITRSIR